MAKVTYASLKLKPNTEVKTVKFGDAEIEVKQYLSIEDKYDIIMSTVKNAKDENGLYNDIKVDLFFHLFLVYKYTGITFTEKQKAAKSNEGKVTIAKAIIYMLFPVVMFLHDAVSVVKNLSSYERFLNYCENNVK